MGRREFIASTTLAATGLLVGCAEDGPTPTSREVFKRRPPEVSGRLIVQPHAPTMLANPGLHPLGLGGSRDGQLFVPTGHSATERLPLLLLLHGAGQSSAPWFGSYDERGEANRVIMLAPDSRGGTWDLVQGAFFDDVGFIERAIAAAFDRCGVDPARISIAGFSDGASYALCLGLLNGDIFSKVIAYSPGFFQLDDAHGKPPVFVSHGTNDPILPINQTSRVIVPILEREGYSTKFVEFSGGHEVPLEISDAALSWLMA